jgi:EAL domain-containing protein (putative c-di-GMP-specific phosphodiesterase class I)
MGRLAPGISLFVNIESATGLVPCPPDLRGIVAEAEQRLSLVAEVTERLEGADWATVTAQVSALRSSGYRIAVDDLGAHWTSLAVLDLLQPDVIKLDLTVSRGTNPKAARIAQAARRHADSTGAIIVAEGLETSDHLGLARRRGARLGQGFLFGVPAPLADVAVTPCRPRLLRT